MNNVVTENKVRDLVEYITTNTVVTIEHSIDKWLEQNPIEQVVGFSDTQVRALADLLYDKTDVSNPHETEYHIHEWLETQTTKPIALSITPPGSRFAEFKRKCVERTDENGYITGDHLLCVDGYLVTYMFIDKDTDNNEYICVNFLGATHLPIDIFEYEVDENNDYDIEWFVLEENSTA